MKKININENQLKIVVENMMIKEAMMDGFSLEVLNKLPSYQKRVNYCKEMLGNHIGKGSSRVIFQISDEKVLKLAFNPKGNAQNGAECDWGRQNYNVMPRIFEHDSENDNYIISEYVLPARKNDFKECLGVDMEEFYEFLKYTYNTYSNEPTYCEMTKDRFNYIIDNYNENLEGFYNYLTDFQNYNGDMIRISSYGMTHHNGQPLLVLLDSGLNDDVYINHYRK